VNKVAFTPETPAQELDKLARVIAVAKRVGTRRIRIFSPETDKQDGGAGWDEVAMTLRPQVELAAREDMVLMHENDGTYFGAFPGNCQRLLAEFAGPNLKAVYDPGNAQMIGTSTMSDWFPWLLPYLDTIHVKDARRDVQKFVYAGQGDGEFVELFRFLKTSGWQGPLTLEPHANMHAEGGYLSGRKNFADAVAAIHTVLDQAGFTL
jgi:sugar phosphate isomerase/epimerase